jgi:transposase-like protein
MSRQRLSRQRWRELIEQQRVSGLGVLAFCQQHGLASSTFFVWKRQLKQEGVLSRDGKPPCAPSSSSKGTSVEPGAKARSSKGAASTSSAPGMAPSSTFVEVTPSPTDDTPDRPVEVVLGDAIVIRVPRGFDPATLRQVVEALS